MLSRRLQRRALEHHLPLLLLTLIVGAPIYILSAGGAIQRASMASAYAGILLITAAIAVGPLNTLRARPNPVSSDLRRDIGIWAAVVSVFHVAVGLFVHLGDPLLYFIPKRGVLRPRIDPFGFANYTGLAATLILVLLLLLSNDLSLRRLGTERWKRLQRWTYPMCGLVLLHAVAFQLVEKQIWPFVVALALTVIAALTFQLRGRRAWLDQRAARSRV